MCRTLIAGVDEAGRGCLAGPVSVAVAVCDQNSQWAVTDSKSYSEKQRELLFHMARKELVAFSYVMIDANVVDEINIRQATLKGMRDAYALIEKFHLSIQEILVDGIDAPIPNSVAIIKGDTKVRAISAASIIAKVVRDRMMHYYHELYPEYRFDLHKGYGTKLHYEKIAEHGLSPIHRRSFLKRVL